MECKRCNNSDISYFYLGSKGYYCRKCVGFKRILYQEDIAPFEYLINANNTDYKFSYELTEYQKRASQETYDYLRQGNNVLLKCITGAGKTDIVVQSIEAYLKKGLKVCYAIPRKEVVIELCKRFKQIFEKSDVCAVYGGHHEKLSGDLIICTTHQLFRYYKTFDLLILDEADAFPLSGNDTLMNIALNSCKGTYVFSTATINSFLKEYLNKLTYKEVNLFVRPNLKPMYVPKTIYGFNSINILILIYLLKREKNQAIIFVSSKKMAKFLYSVLKILFNICYVYSDYEERDINILNFRNNKYQYIISTTILERGISIPNISVYVYYDRKEAFDTSSLVQIVGRVRRGTNSQKGEAFIISAIHSKEIKNCIKDIKESNKKYEMSVL